MSQYDVFSWFTMYLIRCRTLAVAIGRVLLIYSALVQSTGCRNKMCKSCPLGSPMSSPPPPSPPPPPLPPPLTPPPPPHPLLLPILCRCPNLGIREQIELQTPEAEVDRWKPVIARVHKRVRWRLLTGDRIPRGHF